MTDKPYFLRGTVVGVDFAPEDGGRGRGPGGGNGMNPGEWASVDGYDGEGIEMAFVVAASGERRIPENEVNAAITESPYVKVRRVTWREVTPDDHDAIGDDTEYNEQGTGDRWVEVILCADEGPGDDDG